MEGSEQVPLLSPERKSLKNEGNLVFQTDIKSAEGAGGLVNRSGRRRV